MRAGTETAPESIVEVFGAAQPHRAYLLAKSMKVLVHVIERPRRRGSGTE